MIFKIFQFKNYFILNNKVIYLDDVGFEPTKLSHGILSAAPLTARKIILFNNKS